MLIPLSLSLSYTHTHTYICMHMCTLITQGVFLCSVTKSFIHFVSSRMREAWWDLQWKVWVICGNKMPTRCSRGFYCRSYCLLSMFRAPLCPSSGAQEYYTVVAACGISCCGFQVVGLVMCPVCRMLVNQHPANQTHNPQLHTRPAIRKPQHEIPQAAITV